MTTSLCDRGVYSLPWLGPNGERYVVAVDSKGRRVGELVVPAGEDKRAYVNRLWYFLDDVDPEDATAGAPRLVAIPGGAR